MGGKTEDIENWIHTSKLGAGYSQILCHGWVRYLCRKTLRAERGKALGRSKDSKLAREIFRDDEQLLLQLAGCYIPTGTGCHHQGMPRCRAKAFGMKLADLPAAGV